MKDNQGRQLRNLLAAILAVQRGLLKAEDVAGLVKGHDLRRIGPGTSFVDELAIVGQLSAIDVRRLEDDAEQLAQDIESGSTTASSTKFRILTPADTGASGNGPAVMSADRYTDLKHIGSGAMGAVYRARDLRLGREVALKFLAPGGRLGPERPRLSPLKAPAPEMRTTDQGRWSALRKRFLREAIITAYLDGHGVTPVFEVGETQTGVPCYAMRRLHLKESLEDKLVAVRKPNARNRLELLRSFLKACKTIARAHDRGVIHRDIKPCHVLIGIDGSVDVIDWGLARVTYERRGKKVLLGEWAAPYMDDEILGSDGTRIAGTPGYAAPECEQGDASKATRASDVYSLGVILYRILTGSMPSVPGRAWAEKLQHQPGPQAPQQVVEDVPLALSKLAMACIRPEPDLRPPSADAVVDRIEAWFANDQTLDKMRVVSRLVEKAVALARQAPPENSALEIARARSALAELERLEKTVSPGTFSKKVIPHLQHEIETVSDRFRRREFVRMTLICTAVILAFSFMGALVLQRIVDTHFGPARSVAGQVIGMTTTPRTQEPHDEMHTIPLAAEDD